MKEFFESRYYEGYKTVRNKLRKYDTLDLIGGCLKYLHAPAKDKLEYIKRHPWIVLLSIKWALLDQDALRKGRPSPSNREVHSILQCVLDLGNKVRLPDQYDHFGLFFRTVAYQQFIYQRDTSLLSIGRQFHYFGKLPEHNFLKKAFHESAGIHIQTFLELSIVLLAKFQNKSEYLVDAQWFQSLEKGYTKQEILTFLGALSKSFPEVRNILLARDELTREKGLNPRHSSEYSEQSPFVNFPLIPHQEGFLCIEHHLLFRCIEHFVYNRLREYDAGRFMGHFGPIFERYVEKAIQYSNLPYVTENALLAILGNKKSKPKLVDFLIADDGANVFIDAKAVEMSYQGKVTHSSLELSKWVETSILKAIDQAHSVLSALPSVGKNDAVAREREKNYLIVVTYKELYLSNGRDLCDAIGVGKVQEILDLYPGSQRIDTADMHFVTIEEFELLLSAVAQRKIGFVDALERAKAADSSYATKRFEFRQHLERHGFDLEPPDYLKQKTLEEIEKLKKLLL